MKKLLALALCLAAFTAQTACAKTLVAYFSMPETDRAPVTRDEDNSVVTVGGVVLGNTQYVARLIAQATGADTFRIEPETPYPTDHGPLVAQARAELRRKARPALKNTIDLAQYDTIFLGYPIWCADLPMVVYTFLESGDFRGKTVIPFVTHGGSRLAGTPAKIAKAVPGAKVLRDALCIDRNDVEETAAREVPAWLKSLGFSGRERPAPVKGSNFPAAAGQITARIGRGRGGDTPASKRPRPPARQWEQKPVPPDCRRGADRTTT